MAIPDFQTLMLPLLRLTADGKEHTARDVVASLAQEFCLTEDELQQLLPSRRARIFPNRVAWARYYLKIAGLLDVPRRAVFRISARGKDVLKKEPERIDTSFLRQFPEFNLKRDASENEKESTTAVSDEIACVEKTPAEQFEAANILMRSSLSDDLLSSLKRASPAFFERTVVEVLVKMGYGGSLKDAGQAIGRSGDEGVDGIIKEDRLGLDIIYIQAKKWESTISRPEIQKFAGALMGQKARKGVFITTSDFSEGARAFAASIDSKIILVDGKQLADMMIDFSVGVATDATYELKRLDSDYFSEE